MSTGKLKFNASDFRFAVTVGKTTCSITDADAMTCAERSNAKLDRWLEAQPKVYGKSQNDFHFLWNQSAINFDENTYKHTHTARLVCVEPIKKEPCKHEPRNKNDLVPYCKHCGATLVAEWREVE
jgi:hypothetical protein